MAHVEEHLQLSELEGRYRSASEATEARHFQVIWLLAKGHTVREVSEMTSFGQRWLEQLLSRYNTPTAPATTGTRPRPAARWTRTPRPRSAAPWRSSASS